MVEPNPGFAGERLAEPRNTRDVVALRLSGAEREQIAKAAARCELALSSIIRQAALQASAVVQGKAGVTRATGAAASDRKPDEEPAPRLVVIVPEPAGHWVEGELVTWLLPSADATEGDASRTPRR